MKRPDFFALDVELFGPAATAVISPADDDELEYDEPEAVDYRQVAAHYARAGLRVFPVRLTPEKKATDKTPPYGYLWQARATSNVSDVVQDFDDACRRYGEDAVAVAWALGQDGYLALDLDTPGAPPDWWPEVETGAALNHTRRGRHVVWRNPDGTEPGNGTSAFPSSGWGEVRGTGGYIVIAGPDRPGFDVSQLDDLGGFPHPEWLTPYGGKVDAATVARVAEFQAEHTETLFVPALDGVRAYLDGWTPGGDRGAGKHYPAARHDTAYLVACWVAREAAAGLFPAVDGFGVLRGWWTAKVGRQTRVRELESIFRYAIAQADAEPERIADIRAKHDGSRLRFGPPPGVDPDTGEMPARALPPAFPATFWDERPCLAVIRDAAHSRLLAVEAVFATVLARVVALSPPTLRLPAVVVATSPLNLITVTVDPSGAGKSGAQATARELLPTVRKDIRDGFLLGSGESIADAFLGPPETKVIDGKKRNVRDQIYVGMLVEVDEGETVAETGRRNGSTLLPQLRTAWSGATLGQENASADRWRRVEAGRYSVGITIATQPAAAAALLADVAGVAQRCLWFAAVDPTMPDDRPAWPGPLDWKPPVTVTSGTVFDIDPAVAAEIVDDRLERVSGRATTTALDAHRNLLRLRVAAVLAELDHRTRITPDDWRLAGIVLDASDLNRSRVLAEAKFAQRTAEQASHARAARRELTVRDTVAERATTAMARAIARKVSRVADAEQRPTTRREVTQCTKGSDRQVGSFDEAVDLALTQGWIVLDADDGFHPGESRPA